MKTSYIGFRIDDDLKESLESLATKENRTLSNYIETILKNYVVLNKSKKFNTT
jgi:predicted transcriptional regulator